MMVGRGRRTPCRGRRALLLHAVHDVGVKVVNLFLRVATGQVPVVKRGDGWREEERRGRQESARSEDRSSELLDERLTLLLDGHGQHPS